MNERERGGARGEGRERENERESYFSPTQVIAILAFSITAGFTNSNNDNSLSCLSTDNATRTVRLTFRYPFRGEDFRASYSPNATSNSSSCGRAGGFENKGFSNMAEFFVVMGVFTFLYCLVALPVYVIFITPKMPFAKWIIVAVSYTLFVFVRIKPDYQYTHTHTVFGSLIIVFFISNSTYYFKIVIPQSFLVVSS